MAIGFWQNQGATPATARQKYYSNHEKKTYFFNPHSATPFKKIKPFTHSVHNTNLPS